MNPSRQELLQAPIVEGPEDINCSRGGLVYEEGGGVYLADDQGEAEEIVEDFNTHFPNHSPLHLFAF
jgi:hypothetical protein